MTDGERWARAALQRLQDGGYSPAAWLRFIAESRARATETRQARPLLARQARRWGAVGGAAWLGRSLLAPRRRVALVGLAWWALVWKMVDWHLGMVEGAKEEPRERLSPADALTLARFWLAPLAAAPSTRRSFAALLTAGAICDLADGRLAAHLGPTRLGREIDVTADIAFFGAATAGAARRGWLSPRAAGWLAARHAAALAFSTAHYILQAAPPPGSAPAGAASGSAAAGR